MTAAEVTKAAARYLKPDNSTLGLFLPTKSPDRTTIPMIADLKKSIGNYKGREDMARGESFDVSPEEYRRPYKKGDFALGHQGGLSGEESCAAAKCTCGSRCATATPSAGGMQLSCQLLPHLMLRGTKSLTHQQIQDELDKLRATLHAEGSPGEVSFSINTRRETLPAVLKLLGQILRQPSLPESELGIAQAVGAGRVGKWADGSARAGRERGPPSSGPLR